MSTESGEETAYGIESGLGWSLGGAVAGAIGAAAFGLLMWLFDPDVLQVAIPGFYGLEAGGVAGWTIHIAHGIVLGLLFGFIVTREFVLGVIRMNPETEALSRTGMMVRVAAAGFVFGLAIWAIIPLLVLPALAGPVGGEAAAEFPAIAIESLLGHLLFGLVLGIVFAVIVDVHARPASSPFEE